MLLKKTPSQLNEFVNNSKAKNLPSELMASLFFVAVSAVLTVLNVVKHASVTMTAATTVLTVGFAIVALLAFNNKLEAARKAIVLLCGAVFSLFALIGGNDGFAILWMLLVPIIGSFWVGLKYGIFLSLYFQIFLVVLFYTPASKIVEGYYTPTFMMRFPILFLTSFLSITYLVWQRQELFEKLHRESYFDALTGLGNRRYYNELSDSISSSGEEDQYTIFSFDLNQLKYANDNFGHEAGDELIKAAADIISEVFQGDNCFRTGGDEFIVISRKTDTDVLVEEFKDKASKWKGKIMHSISISVGYASPADSVGMSLENRVVAADTKMYEDKKAYYKANGIER